NFALGRPRVALQRRITQDAQSDSVLRVILFASVAEAFYLFSTLRVRIGVSVGHVVEDQRKQMKTVNVVTVVFAECDLAQFNSLQGRLKSLLESQLLNQAIGLGVKLPCLGELLPLLGR